MGKLAEMQRNLLEQMMGREAMGDTNPKLVWSDKEVCRNFLCGACPHALFTNTKMDLGPCPKSHAERLKNDFLAARNAEPDDPVFSQYQHEYESSLSAFVDDCDRRIRVAGRRLEKTPEENAKTTALMNEISELGLAIEGGLDKMEQLAEQGKFEESMKEMAAIEALKEEKAGKEGELQRLNDTAGASGQQKLRVCEVCGAYLSAQDTDKRLADHFVGKMHLGYNELRNLVTQFRSARKHAPPPQPSGVSAVPLPPQVQAGTITSPRLTDRERDRDRDYRGDRGFEDRRRVDRERSRSPKRRH